MEERIITKGRMTLVYEKKEIQIADIVICINYKDYVHSKLPKTFVALVLDRTYTMSVIKVVDTGAHLHWPIKNLVLWKAVDR